MTFIDTLRDKDGLIDVSKLIAHYSVDQHRQQADAYFASHSETSMLLRKPFQSVPEAVQILQGLSILLRELKLFQGARIVDFGAGTAWLSRMLAYLNCDVVAVDLSRNALELGRQAIDKDIFAKDLKISYLPYDGVRIPLSDADVERICCFDAFHHVADQRSTLREFFRIMKPGAIAAFHEPGPSHSRAPDSQYEMANYGVIENDIRIEEIAAMAKEIGFRDVRVAWYTPSPIMLEVPQFKNLIDSKLSREDERAIIDRAGSELQNMRLFFLYKPGEEQRDSRQPDGLKAQIEVKLRGRDRESIVGTLTARNVGSSIWLPSAGQPGAVRVGIQLWDDAGKLVALDYSGLRLSETPVKPGESRTVEFSITPPRMPRFSLAFDLVSEFVTWFGRIGASQPATIRLEEFGS